MERIPFHLPDVDLGLTEVRGSVYLEDDFLVIAFETAFLGEFGREPRIVKVEPGALAHVRFERGLFRDRICLRPKKEALLAIMPGNHVDEVHLRVWRIRRKAAERLVAALQAARRPVPT